MAKKSSRRRRLRQQAQSDNPDGLTPFEQEYAYVLKDLRRIFALAALMFVLLIILNIVLQ